MRPQHCAITIVVFLMLNRISRASSARKIRSLGLQSEAQAAMSVSENVPVFACYLLSRAETKSAGVVAVTAPLPTGQRVVQQL